MEDIRWSYDPRTKELDVWDSEQGRIGHYERHGEEGYRNCAQGRLYKINNEKRKLDSIHASMYSDRPFAFGDQEKWAAEVRLEAQKALEAYYEPYLIHWQLTF